MKINLVPGQFLKQTALNDGQSKTCIVVILKLCKTLLACYSHALWWDQAEKWRVSL